MAKKKAKGLEEQKRVDSFLLYMDDKIEKAYQSKVAIVEELIKGMVDFINNMSPYVLRA
jgi:hypothetical protein|tara:strand:+ start:203 stop:379 length:177 start_codon:yes stop_codon:yes gene_type:complete